MKLDRRNFLMAAAILPVCLRQAGAKGDSSDRLACNSWPFRAYFDTPEMHGYRDAKYQLITQEEFPQFLADHFKIHNVEFLPQHFVDTEPGTIEKVKAGLKKANSHCCNLMGVGIPGGAFTKDANHEAIAKDADRWIGVAKALGAPSITIALNAALNLSPVVDMANRRGVKVFFHNDDMKTESAEILTAVIGHLGRNRSGMCPDFGNFATKSAEYALAQLRMLAPYASTICHAKDGIADDGKFYADDFPASMKVMLAGGFRGIYSLEYEGLGQPLDGVRKLMAMTEEYL